MDSQTRQFLSLMESGGDLHAMQQRVSKKGKQKLTDVEDLRGRKVDTKANTMVEWIAETQIKDKKRGLKRGTLVYREGR